MTDLTPESVAVKLMSAFYGNDAEEWLYLVTDPQEKDAFERLGTEHERIVAERIAAAEKAEAERTETLEAICDALGIGIFARDRQTILTNIRSLLRRGACLSVVEDAFQDSCGEDDDQITTSKFSWGASPKEFEKQFNAALADTKNAERALALREALKVCQKCAEWTGLPRSAFAYERHIQRLITAAEAKPEMGEG